MSMQAQFPRLRTEAFTSALLLAGVMLACLAEAFTGTALSFGKLDMMGDIYTTPDEFAFLDVGYTAAKLCGFMIVPALFARFRPLTVIQTAIISIAVFSLLMASTVSLYPLVCFRMAQGLAGGIILVGGQSLLFSFFSEKAQPITQLIFAIGAVVFPATFVSLFEGWMVDALSWEAIFFTAAGLGALGLFFLAGVSLKVMRHSGPKRADGLGFFLFAVAAFCLTYVAQEGCRWNWFEATHILVITLVGFAALLTCVIRWVLYSKQKGIVNLAVFANRDFCFGFLASVAAGVALFGSNWLIPGFTMNVLGYTATDAGALIGFGGLVFVLSLTVTALLLILTPVKPLATVPLGLFLIMVGLWLFSGATSDSGNADLLLPLLIRGTGLGFLFLSLTIYALGGLRGDHIAQGVALFTTHRQFGGLFGVAFLQRYLDHQNALNNSVLSSHLETGGVLLAERLSSIQAALQSRGMEAGEAARASVVYLKKSLGTQGGTISHNEAFLMIVVVLCCVAPLLISFKIWLAKRGSAHAALNGIE